jgi:cellulose synthase/poly-beta-1,6-N-acetylglucosamine synthase-like glycosyltransferase
LPLVQSAIKRHNTETGGRQRAEIIIMTEHFTTCSLKCCAHHHGLYDLDPSFEAIVILDADTNPPRDWLKRLVEPLSDPRFPVATGLRWYIPAQINAGSLVRYLWNAAAIVQQELYRIPWGGSLALRRELFTETNLLERWKHTFTEDTPIPSVIRQVKGKVAIVPSLFLVNRETCGLRSFHRWVKRQMLCAKLYHPAWGAILAQAVLITLPVLAVIGTSFAGVFFHNDLVTSLSAASFGIYWCGVLVTMLMMEEAIRYIVRRNGETVEKWSFARTVLTCLMIPVTQGVYASALFWLHFLRKVEWRGIEYEVKKGQIRLLEYKPYTSKPSEEGRSL